MDDEESVGVFYDLINYLVDTIEENMELRAENIRLRRELEHSNPWYPRDPTWQPAPGWFDEGWVDPMDDNLPPPA